jgi:hypothetical protein
LSTLGGFADQVLGHAAVLGQHQQADRVDVEPAGRHQRAQLGRVEDFRRRVVGPAVFRLDQHHGRLVAVLGLAADIAHGFVDQYRHALGLLGGGLAFHGDFLARVDLGAQFGDDLAIDPYPAARYPLVGFAARAQAQFGHAFGQA